MQIQESANTAVFFGTGIQRNNLPTKKLICLINKEKEI